MGEIRHLPSPDILKDHRLERIVAAAKADVGFWLMVQEREMERQAIRAEVDLDGSAEQAIDRPVPGRLTPTITELADDLVSRMFGPCTSETLALVEQALLDAAKVELSGGQASLNSEAVENDDQI
ncbi:Hypothetical protein NGAL_HAMBI1145_53060 [Neorhizobium galegae bv. officinalis]|uniref:Uncharacterized protein n=1 Tax=Neorhizobium galegae bv. officinalis TaxID=323656 RepID=A0A0T7FZ72_NEOGA|nr:hypothetical protein [Neorhizobium galegae]CDZ40262.1 Hypothetical protein NGAL_HAMBI1145_53060 [Neorhizobium galegae bv. officinalis]